MNPNQQLRFSASRSVRSPLLLEEEGQIEFVYQLPQGQTLTNVIVYDEETLKPETIDVFDIGFFHVSSQRRFTLDAKLSYQNVFDQIRTKRNTEYTQDLTDGQGRFYTNRENYSLKSVEFEIDYQPVDTVRFKLGYSHGFDLRALSYERSLTPEHSLSLFASKRFADRLTLSAEYYYTSDWIWDDVRDRSRVNRLDLRLEKAFDLGRVQAAVALQGEWRLGRNVDYLERNDVEDLYFAKAMFRF